ncbi:MAG: NADPH-dependent FMN reductase, partial [Alphaproteobacteria bacterium]|nr:NADPH-dependent FMN reductase [Alphaproteobacteria bacterium]
MTQPTVAVVVGSLADGANRKFANAIAKLAAGRLDFRFVEIRDLPLYNYELEKPSYPSAAVRLKQEIEAADAVLF